MLDRENIIVVLAGVRAILWHIRAACGRTHASPERHIHQTSQQAGSHDSQSLRVRVRARAREIQDRQAEPSSVKNG